MIRIFTPFHLREGEHNNRFYMRTRLIRRLPSSEDDHFSNEIQS